jgi:S-adenosylmethionine synthetase
VRKSGEIAGLRPDGKTQVTVDYDGGTVVRTDTVIISAQHAPGIKMDKLKHELTEKVIKAVIPAKYIDKNTRILINPTGRFEIGGPVGDSGLTGRKIIADAYGGYAPHGGGAFSGKDPTKTDRSAAYYARYICKNVVAAGLAKKCELQISYAIGVAQPVNVTVNTFGTGKAGDAEIAAVILKHFDPRPAAIIDELDLRRPIYSATSVYGHFGKPGLSWENTGMAKKL